MRQFSIALLLLTLAACAPTEYGLGDNLVVVVPGADGKVGAITVDDGRGPQLLDSAYAAREMRGGQAQPAAVGANDVQQIFGQALAARPIPPNRFTLYFVAATDELTPESLTRYQAVFNDVKRRAAYEVEVVGHTDTTSSVDFNARLSLERANAIRARLGRDGLDTRTIMVAGRGKLDLAVPTADQVAEARNRRVEITVR